jgi:hypothetical protein
MNVTARDFDSESAAIFRRHFGERLELTVENLLRLREAGINVALWAFRQGIDCPPASRSAQIAASIRFEAERRRIDREVPWTVETWEERERLKTENIARFEREFADALQANRVAECQFIVDTFAARQSRRAA